jgi:sulfotransferase
MNKTYHFLSGLPRSGNTLLSAILNQNPQIYSSPISPLCDMMFNLEKQLNSESGIRNYENKKRIINSLLEMPNLFYKDINKPIVIDREKVWGTPDNLSIIRQYINPNPKIIFTVRSVPEILASFINLNPRYLTNEAFNVGLYSANYLTKKDLLCEYLMLPNGDIAKALFALASAFMPENQGIFHIVEYDDLVTKPEETMTNIYSFLELEDYKHDFSNIVKNEVDNDEAYGLPSNLHTITNSLVKSVTDTNVLSEYIRHKYDKAEFWRDTSLLQIPNEY